MIRNTVFFFKTKIRKRQQHGEVFCESTQLIYGNYSTAAFLLIFAIFAIQHSGFFNFSIFGVISDDPEGEK